MDYQTIKDEIMNKEFKKIYLLHGEEEYLMNMVFNVLKTSIAKSKGLDFEYISINEVNSAKEILDQVSTYSFFGTSKFIKCFNCNLFSNKFEDANMLLDLKDHIIEDYYIVFLEKDLQKNTKVYKYFKDNKFSYEFKTPKPYDLKKFIKDTFTKEKKQISSSNVDLLLEYSGSNMSFINQNIQKLLLYLKDEKEVKAEDIKLLSTGTIDTRAYELTNYLCSKNFDKALETYKDLSSLKYGLPYFSTLLFNHFADIYYLKVNDITFSNDFKQKKQIECGRNFKIENLVEILESIKENDHLFKSGKIDQESGLYTIFSKITSY